jgi:hypothetical protein
VRRGFVKRPGVWAHSSRKRFFLKKEAKTFSSAVADSPASPRQHVQKFFGSFFQKRTLTLP